MYEEYIYTLKKVSGGSCKKQQKYSVYKYLLPIFEHQNSKVHHILAADVLVLHRTG